MVAVMTAVGILVFVIGLLISIAWHELGHLSTAKLFGIRVPQYMVGFGPTLWSRKKGETEYGIKAIPFGGYIRMIGMFPPGEDGRITKRSSSAVRTMIEDAREASYEELQEGDESRLFYTRKPWKRVIVMFAGPFMNLILAFGLFTTVNMGFGVPTELPAIGSVSQCIVKAGDPTDTCPAGAKPTPAAEAGLKQGDKVLSFDGDRIRDYKQLQADIRRSAGRQVAIVVERDGQQLTLSPTIAVNQVQKYDANDRPVKGQTVEAGFLGFSPKREIVQQTFGQSLDRMYDMGESGVKSLAALPGKIPGLWNAVVGDAPRDPDSPVGMLGAARVSGEVFSSDMPASQRVADFVFMLAAINLSLFLFNMLPLLPLDGGHIAGALWESLRRGVSKVLRRPDPGPFDVAKLMPFAYVVASVFIGFTLLVLVADLVNPVKIS